MTVSQTKANSYLNHQYGKATWPVSTAQEVALLSAAPTPTTPWASLTRVDYGSYADVTTAPADWNTAAAGTLTNQAEIVFPQATSPAGSNATHVAIRDAATGENYSYAALVTPRPIGNGETPKFAVGAWTHALT